MRTIAEIATDIEQAWPTMNAQARYYLHLLKQAKGPEDTVKGMSVDDLTNSFLEACKRWNTPKSKHLRAELCSVVYSAEETSSN